MRTTSAVLTLAVLLLAACGAPPPRGGAAVTPTHSPTPSASATILATPTPQESTTPVPTPTPTPTAVPNPVTTVSCTGSNPGSDPVVLVGAPQGQKFVYDVSDPLRPHRLCRIAGATNVRLLSNTSMEYYGTDGAAWSVERQTFGSQPVLIGPAPTGTYQVVGGVNGTSAYERQVQDPSGQCCGSGEIHLVTGRTDRVLCSYQVPIIGIGPARFFPSSLFAFSADGQFLAVMERFGARACPLLVRASDGAGIAAIPDGTEGGFWSSHGALLYLETQAGMQQWTPAGGFRALSSQVWLDPSEAPGGRRIAYTYYKNPTAGDGDLRVGVYDVSTGVIAGVPDKPRSEAGFLTPSLIWYLEEGPCSDCTWTKAPTGNVLAYDLTTKTESAVTFAPGEAPVTTQDFQGFGISLAPAG